VKHWKYALALVIGLAVMPAARAATPPIASTEIDALLEAVEESECEFYRNGSWYDGKAAQSHLRYKYELLAHANRIKTAEDFIDKAATKSSLSGRAYAVKCSGTDAISSSEWLRETLACYRNLDAQHIPCRDACTRRLSRIGKPQSSG
jgi:Family of unknown function (DUF5329)